MKILSYKKTPKGTKILKAICNAKLNPLETRTRAVTHVQGLDLFKSFKEKFDRHKELIQVLQQVKRPLDSPHLRDGHDDLAAMQAELIGLHKKYEAENPVYLTPANSILVDDNFAHTIETDLKGCTDGEYICFEIDEDGKGFKHYKLMGAKVGSRYRLPDDLAWRTIVEVDEKVPTDAMFTKPDEAELKRINAKRIKALDPEARTAEKAVALEAAENVCIKACMRADYLGGTTADKDKQTARKELEAAKKDIQTLYKV